MHQNPVRRAGALTLLASLSAFVLAAAPAGATASTKPVSALVSVTPSGKTGNGQSMVSSLSTGGRFVAFASVASDLVPSDTNGKSDVFVRDTLTSTTVRVSVAGGGGQGDGTSDQPSISRDGRYVAFRSDATNLVPGDGNGVGDIFVRDLRNKTTTRASVAAGSNAEATGGASTDPVISGGGLQVTFESTATNLTPGDGNGAADVFVRDFDTLTTERISVTSSETPITLSSRNPSISGTGRYVVFTSMTNQVGAFTDSYDDVFLRDRAAGTTERVSLSGDSSHPDGLSDRGAVSDDGRFIAFMSIAGNLTMNSDENTYADIYLRDRTTGGVELISQGTGGSATALGTGGAPSISASGTKVAFTGLSTGFTAGDTNNSVDVFVRDTSAQTTSRASTTTAGGQLTGSSQYPAISSDGAAVTYSTMSLAGYPSDTNSGHDVYVRSSYQLGPFADSSALLKRTAMDFTGAALSAPALKAADDKIQFGTASPASTINAYAHGAFDDHRGPVMRLYWAFFKRAPDLGGLTYWAGKHAGGMKMAQIANGFAKSNEFQTNFGGGTDTQFITLVYTNVLERQPDPAGLAHWVAKLSAGVSRGEMMVNFSESSEGIRKMRGETDTALVFLGMLHRAPTTGDVISYANALELQGGLPTEALIVAVLTWPEYDALIP